jgi:hypothetical protein
MGSCVLFKVLLQVLSEAMKTLGVAAVIQTTKAVQYEVWIVKIALEAITPLNVAYLFY